MRIEFLESRLLLCDCAAHNLLAQAPADTVASDLPASAADTAAAPAKANAAPSASDATPAAAGAQLLPDMFPLVSPANGFVYGWTYDLAEQPGHVLLRLTTATGNRGRGDLELNGGNVLPNGSQEVYQRIYLEGGGSIDRLAGTFTYHPSHEHIHFDDFAAYRLRQLTPDNGVGPSVAEGEKVSFCLLDSVHFDDTLPGSPILGRFINCGQMQGISVGWADVYDKTLPDQWIDITNVPDGPYWLEVQADPLNRILESDETNNTVRILINVHKPSPDPSVVETYPTGQFPAPASSLDFSFDQDMKTNSFSIADDLVSFTGPAGADLRGQVTGFSWPNAHTLRVSFNTQSALGSYAMTIGPGILAADDGHAMDQDVDKVPGEIPQDRYTGTFNIDSRLGPDAFGYEARSFPYENLDLVKDAPGTFVVMDDKDDVSIPLDLGANTFSFYGTNYTGPSKLYVSDNGIITLGGGNTVYPDFDLTTNPVAATIAPLWDDWLTNATPNDMVLGRFDDLNHDGAPDRLVIEWSSVRRYADPGPETAKDVTFQAILSLNTGPAPGAIVFNYRDIDTGSGYSNGGDATVGIKGVGDQTFEGRRLLISQNRGNYPLVASGRAIRIAQGPSEVVGRRLFYNGSAFDEGNPAANWHDDAAIAPDKFAYTNPPAPGGARATFVNVSSYTRGINGVMVDLARLYNKLPVVSDFDFRAATDPAGPWSLAPTPSLSIRRNDGASGSDRLTFVWPDNAIRNTWLRVTVKATPSTGLSAPDVFYFGHLAGESGDAAADTGAVVTALDVTHTRAAMTPAAVGLASRFDFNRDGRVDTRDLATARSDQQASLPWLSAANTATAGPNYTLRPPVEVFRDSPTRRTELLLDDSPPVL